MTRLAMLVLVAAACGKDPNAVPKADVTAEHVAAVNAAVPAELKGTLEFELATVKEGKGRREGSFKVAAPKGWKPGFMPGELEPADADNFGSKTLGRTSFRVGSNCDGACEKKDWAATSDKVNFAQYASGQVKGKVVKDEKGKNTRTLVFEHEVSESFPEKDVAVTIVRAWWDPDGSRYFTCSAELGTPVKAAAAAFELACTKVAGG